jgi:hypothetical protein
LESVYFLLLQRTRDKESVVWGAFADVILMIDNQKYEDEGGAEEREKKTWEWLVTE